LQFCLLERHVVRVIWVHAQNSRV